MTWQGELTMVRRPVPARLAGTRPEEAGEVWALACARSDAGDPELALRVLATMSGRWSPGERADGVPAEDVYDAVLAKHHARAGDYPVVVQALRRLLERSPDPSVPGNQVALAAARLTAAVFDDRPLDDPAIAGVGRQLLGWADQGVDVSLVGTALAQLVQGRPADAAGTLRAVVAGLADWSELAGPEQAFVRGVLAICVAEAGDLVQARLWLADVPYWSPWHAIAERRIDRLAH